MKLEFLAKASNVARSVKANEFIHHKLCNIIEACLASADEDDIVKCLVSTTIGDAANPCVDPYLVEITVHNESGVMLSTFKASDVFLKPPSTGSTIL